MILSKKITIVIIIVSLIIIFMGIEYIFTNQIIEGAASISNNVAPCSCEALQNLASLYNSETMTLNDLSVKGKFNLLPKGIIVAWTGTTVPEGWALCDGSTKDAPNLSGKFILGLGGKYNIAGKTGGSEQMQKHNHVMGNQMCTDGLCATEVKYKYQTGTGYTNRYDPPPPRTNDAGAGNAGNMPPYYVLAYIMKL